MIIQDGTDDSLKSSVFEENTEMPHFSGARRVQNSLGNYQQTGLFPEFWQS
ncbi:MAG: hypothetical protein ACI92Z_002421 [Paracoccaceae bacterium]